MKNKYIAGLLAFFFGIFGVHRFYLGQPVLGVLYLIFFWTAIPALIGLIDAIIFLSMDQDDFDRKYNRHYFYPDHNRYDTDFKRKDSRNYRREQRYQKEDYRQQRPENARPQGRPFRPQTPPMSTPAQRSNPFKLTGIEKYKDFDYEGAIEDFIKALAIQPNDVAVHFNLACSYSLSEEKEKAFYHLSKAVEYGFVDFKRLQEHDALAYLRIQDEFEEFKNNGYRIENLPLSPSADISETINNLSQESKEDLLSQNSLLLEQIKRLGELRERGLLTNEEFEIQKRKLLE